MPWFTAAVLVYCCVAGLMPPLAISLCSNLPSISMWRRASVLKLWCRNAKEPSFPMDGMGVCWKRTKTVRLATKVMMIWWRRYDRLIPWTPLRHQFKILFGNQKQNSVHMQNKSSVSMEATTAAFCPSPKRVTSHEAAGWHFKSESL